MRQSIPNMKRIKLDDLINYITINFINTKTNNDNELSDEYVCNNTEIHENIYLASPNHISVNINKLPEKLNNIFKMHYEYLFRMGVMKNNLANKDNVSLISSILACVSENFINQNAQIQQLYISHLTNNLVSYVNGEKFIDNGYKKMGIKQIETANQIKNYQNTKTSMKILSDYLDVNLFLINVQSDQLLASSYINKFRKNIILVYLSDNYFEPIEYSAIRIFDFDHPMILKILEEKLYQYAFPDDETSYSLSKYLPSNKSDKYTYAEKRLLMIFKNAESVNNEKKTVQINNIVNEQQNKLTQSPIIPIENDVEGINEIIECSEICDRVIPDLSDIDSNAESDRESIPDVKLMKKKSEIAKSLKSKIYDEKKNKLEELQNDAKSLGLSIEIPTKNGKPKNKTKKDLISDISAVLERF